MEPLTIPTLLVKASPGDGLDGVVIGIPTLLVDGVPVKWPTIGDWRLVFSEEGVAELHIAIPVRLEVA